MGDAVLDEPEVKTVVTNTASVVVSDTAMLVVSDTTIDILEIGIQGPAGRDGKDLSISTDSGNRLSIGSDGGLFVPELLVDPVESYLLARG